MTPQGWLVHNQLLDQRQSYRESRRSAMIYKPKEAQQMATCAPVGAAQ